MVVKKGERELLKIEIPSLEVKYENLHEKESVRNEWKRIIAKNIIEIMNDVKNELATHNISLSDWEIEDY